MCAMGMSLRSCEVDVRVGGKHRFEFEPDAMAFFGTYLEVTPHSRLVWTNEERSSRSGPPVLMLQTSARAGRAEVLLNLCERNHHHHWIDRTLVKSGTY